MKSLIFSLFLASGSWFQLNTTTTTPVIVDNKPVVVVVETKPVVTTPPKTETVPSGEAERILFYANKYTYVSESKGANRSPEIDLWNKFTGAPMGSPYCASFVSYMHKLAGVKAPVSAWSPDSVGSKNIPFSQVRGADVFGLYFSSKGRVAHTGFIEKVSGSLVYTVEANTSPTSAYGAASDRDGDGVFKKTRAKSLMASSKNKYSRFWK